MTRWEISMEAQILAEGATDERGRIFYDANIEKPPAPSLRKRRVVLTVVSEDDDEILAKQGLACLRQMRLLRLCREAHEQGAVLAFEDLTKLLLTSLSTVKRDLRLLRIQGLEVPIYRKKQRSIKSR